MSRQPGPASKPLNDDHHKLWQVSVSSLKLRYLDEYAVGRSVLDIGSGAGYYARALLARGYQVTGLDLEPKQDVDYPFVRARLGAIPFGAPFDTVLAFDVLEHECDEAAALRELRRLTAYRLLLSVPNADNHLLVPYNLTYKHHIDKTHKREYMESELRQKLESVGFRIIHLRKEGPVRPAFISEFVRVRVMRKAVRYFVKGLFRMRILHNSQLMADLYVVAEPD